jgi:hypothetical protein
MAPDWAYPGQVEGERSNLPSPAVREDDHLSRSAAADQAQGDGIMDEVKRTYRDVKTDAKKAVRGVDGTDLKDSVGNAGDEASKELGNLGDDVRKAGRERGGPLGDPATKLEPPR